MPRTRAKQYPRTRTDLRGEPIVGMYDQLDSAVARPNMARELTNCYLPPGKGGRMVLGRPGIAALGAQLGSMGVRTVQYLGQFTKLAGTRYTSAIVGGKFYTLDWGTSTWSEAVNAATFSGASITVSTTARFHSAVLADKVIFSDGVNTPWMWDGTTNGGLTKLTSAPVLYGPMCVYYAKLFGIKKDERDTFVWCEEGDPTTGYEFGGYNNAWSPLGAGQFHALASSNNALYAFESRRAIRITGAVDTDFTTSGTRSDLSERTGTFGFPLVTDDGIVFVSADGAPYIVRGGLNNMWEDCQTATSAMAVGSLAKAILVEWPIIDAVLVGVPLEPNTVVSQWLVFRLSGEEPRYIGRWDLGLNDMGSVVLNDSLVPAFLLSGNADGYIYQMGQPTGLTWDDGFVAGTSMIPHTVTWHPLGVDVDTDRTFDRMTALLGGETSQTQITSSYQTTRGTSTGQTATVTGSSGALLGIGFTLGTSTFAGAQPERRVVFGLNGWGRWIAPTVRHEQVGKTFSLKAVTVEAYPWGTDPTLP